jgi:hypothetical protein
MFGRYERDSPKRVNIFDDSRFGRPTVVPDVDPRSLKRIVTAREGSPGRDLMSAIREVPPAAQNNGLVATPAAPSNATHRDILARVLLQAPGHETMAKYDHATNPVPDVVLLRVRASSLHDFAATIEEELERAHNLHVRISTLHYSPFEGRGPWHVVPRVHSDSAAESEPIQSSPMTLGSTPISSTVVRRQPGAASQLELPRRNDAFGGLSPLESSSPPQRPFDLIPDRVAVRLVPGARRLSFNITVMLPPGATIGAEAGVIHRRAAAVITTLASLFRALSTLCYFTLVPAEHRVLVHNDRAGGYLPLCHVAQMGSHSSLLVDLTGLSMSAIDELMAREEQAQRRLNPHALNPAATTQPRTMQDYRAALHEPRAQTRQGLDDVDDVAQRARVRSDFVFAPPPSMVESAVTKLERPSAEDDARGRLASQRGKVNFNVVNFNVAARVKTPAAPTSLSRATRNGGDGAAGEFNGYRDELHEPPPGEYFGGGALDVVVAPADPDAVAASIIPSVLPLPENDSPRREALGFTEAAAWEAAVRFTPRIKTTIVKTPGLPGASPFVGPRAVIECATPQEEKRALIHETMKRVIAHVDKDFFEFGALTTITSDVVQKFRASYPNGIAVRFPLTRADEKTLHDLVDEAMKSSLRARVAEGDDVPFMRSRHIARTVERVKLEQRQAAGLPPPPQTNTGPKFALVSPERVRDSKALDAAVPDPSDARALVDADTPPHRRLPSTWKAQPPLRPRVVLTRPQYDRSTDTLTFYATTSLDLFGLSSAAVAEQRREAGRLNTVERARRDADTPAPSFHWFMCQGAENRNVGRLSGDVPLDAMVDLGIAKMHVLQHTVPITLSLEISLVRRMEASHDEEGYWTDALQPGVPYTIGVTVRDTEGTSLTALCAFTIPSAFRARREPHSFAASSPGSHHAPSSQKSTPSRGDELVTL